MKRLRIVFVALALGVIALAWQQVGAARAGLVVRELNREGLLLLYLAPQDVKGAPGVLVAHGFAGSRQLMLAYGYTLAHAGYAVLLWDFDGHGANPARLVRDSLQHDLERAYAALIEQPEVDPARLALLGHSMGSGAVMAAAIRDPQRYAATIAISPTGADVTPERPRNLLLQAGSLEGSFVVNARKLLTAGGGPSDDFAAGRARRLIVVPNAEHITILFRSESHRAALAWLAQAFGEPRDTAYVDRRILWYVAHLLGWMLLALAGAPLLRARQTASGRGRAPLVAWLGLLTGALLAGGALTAANRVTPVAALGGLQVGGAVGLWFLVAGGVWLALGRGISRPAPRDLALGLAFFALLSLAFGVLAQAVWVPWWLNAPRLLRWPCLALACLPWFLAAGAAQGGRRALWWLAQSIATVGGLLLALTLVPSLGFLVLLMPLLPVILGVLAVIGGAFGRPWAYGVGAALFFGWVLAAVFPLA